MDVWCHKSGQNKELKEFEEYREGEISNKVQGSRLIMWHGHVMRREEEYVGETVMVMDVQGRRREGRVKRRWMGSIRHDLTENRL